MTTGKLSRSETTGTAELIGSCAATMGPGYFVIAILGCADGGAACTPVATLPAHYATQAECSVATATALESHNDFDFPTLLAQCRAQSPSVSKGGETSQEVALAQRG